MASFCFVLVDGKFCVCVLTLFVCWTAGILIPNEVDRITDLRSDARCVLVVEKDCTFQKLIDHRIQHFIGPCILITVRISISRSRSHLYAFFAQQGKGYPDVTTRRFVRKLWDDLKLPPLALVDADPHGVSIMAVYRFGSQVLDDSRKSWSCMHC